MDVEELSITPDYPCGPGAGPNETYALSFRKTWGSGVRIIGPPGGSARFTTIAELEVYCTGEARSGFVVRHPILFPS